MRGLPIQTDLSASELRALARRERRPRVAPRLYAIAHVLDGVSRAEAARLCGMDRQALRNAVVRFNAEGLGRLVDRARSRAAAERGQAGGTRGPDPARTTPGAERVVELDPGRPVPGDRGELGQALPPRQHVARRAPPRVLAAEDAAGPPAIQCPGAGSVRKKGLQRALDDVAAAHPGKRITLWSQMLWERTLLG